MKKQLLTLGIIGILVAISISGCLENQDENGNIHLSGKVTLTTDKTEYEQNETINITLYNGLNVSIFSHMANAPIFSISIEKKTLDGWQSFLRLVNGQIVIMILMFLEK